MIRILTALPLIASTVAAGEPNAAPAYRELLADYETIPSSRIEALRTMPAYLEPCDPTLTVRVRSLADRLHPAARNTISDFELDYSQGFELQLPHLAPMRGLTQAMFADVRRRTLAGDGPAAARLLDTIDRMALHLGQDRTLISSLVGMSMLQASCNAIEFMIEQDQLSARDAAMLLRGFEGIDERDPTGLAIALDTERQSMGDWVRDQFASPSGGATVGQLLGQLDPKGLGDVDGYDRAMRDLTDTMAMDDREAAQTRLSAIDRQLQSGEYGKLAQLLVTSLDRVFVMRFEFEETLSAVRTTLQRIASGEAAEGIEPNAAWRYIETARALDDAARAEDVDVAARTALLDELMLTALMERCEFPIDEDTPRPVIPVWTTGLHRGGRWLVEDARRRIAAGDIDGAVGRLDTTIALAADLSTSPHLADALIAHEMTTDAMKLIVELDEDERLDDAARRRLLVTLRTIKASDPFGYRQSADDSRRLLEQWCAGTERSTMIESLPVDGDGMLFAIAFHEMNIDPEAPPAHCWPLPIDVDALHGLIDPAAIAEARQQGRDAVEASQVDVEIGMEPSPGIVPETIEQRRADAAGQLREWKRRLGN